MVDHMNEKQFNIIADKVLRKPLQKKAAFDVIFNNLTHYQAERKHNCVPNTVERSVKIIEEHYKHCLLVVTGK